MAVPFLSQRLKMADYIAARRPATLGVLYISTRDQLVLASFRMSQGVLFALLNATVYWALLLAAKHQR